MIMQGPGDVYYSALQAEPEMHPLVQMGMSLVPFGIAAGAGYYSMYASMGGEYTFFDLIQKQIKNAATRTPFGIANTFRIPEIMDPFVSPQLRGFEVIEEADKKFARYTIGNEFLQTEETFSFLKRIMGEKKFKDVETLLRTKDASRLVIEQDLNRKTGDVFLEQTERVPVTDEKGGRTLVDQAIPGSRKKILENQLFLNTISNPDTYDLYARVGVGAEIDPITRGAVSSLDLGRDVDVERIFYNTETKARPSVIPFPSLLDTSADMQARLSYLTAYPTFEMSRFNKLVKGTFEQVPILGSVVEGSLKSLGITPYTSPQPFYKQFASIGFKASAIGGAYMGLRTIDHYREQYGMLGNIVAATGTSLLGAGLTSNYLKKNNIVNRTLPKRVAMGMFATQMLMPGFEVGTTEGIATTLVNADITRSYIGQYSGMSFIRRGIEGLLPGFTDGTTGAFFGVSLALASYGGLGKKILESEKKILPELIRRRIGFAPSSKIVIPESKTKSLERAVYDYMRPANNLAGKTSLELPFFEKLNNFEEMFKSDQYREVFEKVTKGKAFEDLTAMERRKLRSPGFFRSIVTPLIETYDFKKGDAHIVSAKLFDALDKQASITHYDKYMKENTLHDSLFKRLESIGKRYKGANFFGKIGKKIEEFGAKAYHSFFGASLGGEAYREGLEKLGLKPRLGRAGTLFAAGMLVHQAVTGSLFGTLETPEELTEIYEGKKLVEVKNGRFWEGGGTPYEGMETSYFRPHAYHLLMTKAKEKSVWGDEHAVYNPISKFVLENFTYHLEDKNYYTRPYPLTSPAFENLPVVGSVLAPTIGSLIKPQKFMHEDELFQVNEFGETEFLYQKEYGSSEALGGLPPGKPITTNNLFYRMGELQYQFREIAGITGYAQNLMQKVFTGRETIGTMRPVMASSGMMDSPVLNYWDLEIGGAFFLSEPIRRILPRPKAEQDVYNPVMNSMPSWLPNRFKRGDPYRSVKSGAARLPGEGYEALYPELTNIDPEDYPDIHKYKILADVAPKSSESFRVQQNLLERRAAEATTDYENKILDDVLVMHRKRLSKIQDFEPHKNAIEVPLVSDITQGAYALGETIVRKGVAPAEYIVPGGFRPAQKLLGKTRDIVETYEFDRLYGTPHAFWDAPIRDWFRPSFYSAANMVGFDGKPGHVQEREALSEQFDKLQFIKYMRLAETAQSPKDRKRFLGLASKTRVGVNPQGDALGIYMALPETEKKYFDAFMNAKESDRDRILEMIPEDQQGLYINLWNRIDSGNTQSLYRDSHSQLNEHEMLEKYHEVSSSEQGKLPPADWIGWHNEVDLEDVKLKYIQSLGKDIHDYDMWDSSSRRIQRKPYLDGAEKFIYRGGNVSERSDTRSIMNKMMGVNLNNVSMHSNGYGNSVAEVSYTQDLTPTLLQQLYQNI